MEEPQHSIIHSHFSCPEYRPERTNLLSQPVSGDGGMRIGIHTSIAGNVTSALELASNIGANTLQIFSASPRMWSRSVDGSRAADPSVLRFRERRRELKLAPLVVHSNYLINLASQQRVLRARSIQAFRGEIVRAIALGAEFLVIHPGSAGGAEMNTAIASIAAGLEQAARGLDFGPLRILLENTAGQGTSVGSRFSELKSILDLCPGIPLGVCLDTAHVFAAGHDLRCNAGLEGVLEEVSATVGLDRVFVVHVNDSKTPLGSRVDRHEHIGKGKIGREAFRWILNHPLLAGCAFILETPIDRPGDDRRNVNTLWRLAGFRPRGVCGARDGFKMRKSRTAR